MDWFLHKGVLAKSQKFRAKGAANACNIISIHLSVTLGLGRVERLEAFRIPPKINKF
jgi:hypothetical protein